MGAYFFKLAFICLFTIGASIQAEMPMQGKNMQLRGSIKTSKPNMQNILFIQVAKEAIISHDSADPPNTFRLTLKEPQPNLAYFGDQPQRFTGKIPIETFLKNWALGEGVMQGTAAASELNGALVNTSTTLQKINDLSESLILLTDPVYDPDNHELRFKIRGFGNTNLTVGRHANPMLLIDNN